MKLFNVIILCCFIVAILILWWIKRVETFPAVLLVGALIAVLIGEIFEKKEKDYFQPK